MAGVLQPAFHRNAPRFPRFSARSAQTVHDRRRPRELRRERPHPRPV